MTGKFTPKFTHDCEKCEFLGHLSWTGEVIEAKASIGTTGHAVSYIEPATPEFDLYWCSKLKGLPTVIARYGDDGPDYKSGIRAGETGDAELAAALKLAHERGFTE